MSLAQRIATLRKPRVIDEGAARLEIERGQKAEALMRDEAFNDAFKAVQDYYLGAWKDSDSHDVETRERCHVAVNLLDDIRNHLATAVRSGAQARDKLENALAHR